MGRVLPELFSFYLEFCFSSPLELKEKVIIPLILIFFRTSRCIVIIQIVKTNLYINRSYFLGLSRKIGRI